jgi:hypothetical protein
MPPADGPRKIPVVFYRTRSGIEVVRNWLRDKAAMAIRKKRARTTGKLSTLDDFLTADGKREEFEAVAIKEVLAWQIAQWKALTDKDVQALRQRLQALAKNILKIAKPNEAETEKEFIYPVIEALGWTMRRPFAPGSMANSAIPLTLCAGNSAWAQQMRELGIPRRRMSLVACQKKWRLCT